MRFGALIFVLSIASPTLAYASDAATCVQTTLSSLGYDVGTVDGALGKRSTIAATALAADFGLTLPPLTEATAQQWCDAAQGAATSPEAAVMKSKARILLPVDVLNNLAKVPSEKARMLCYARNGVSALNIDPISKIEGFTSRMADVVEQVPHARALEGFVSTFGSQATLAMATQNEELKQTLVKTLAKWADADALLATRSCVKPNGELINTGKCTEWTVKDGSDLSGMKDATFTTMLGVSLIRAYYAALSDTDPVGLAAQHKSIATWIDKFSERLKRPEKVGFGLNVAWYWPTIINDLATGKQAEARKLLTAIDQGMV